MPYTFVVLSLMCVDVVLASARAAAQTPTVGMTSKTIFYLPFFVGQKTGFYNAENLKVELILSEFWGQALRKSSICSQSGSG